MKLKRPAIVLLTAAGFACTGALFLSFSPPPFDQSLFEQNPPNVLHIWVQKLDYCPEDGSNMIMKIQYDGNVDGGMPETLGLYHSGGSMTTFKDDGAAPDALAGDLVYTAYITENISHFRSQMIAMEDAIRTAGGYTKWTGHVGEVVTDVPDFDVDAFDNFGEVEIDPELINAVDCGTALLKQHSLFITDLSVVEDPSRTYNKDV